MNQDINFSVPHTIYSTILHPAMDDRTVATEEGEGMRGQQNESNSEDDGLLEYAEQRILSLVIYIYLSIGSVVLSRAFAIINQEILL